MCEFYSVSQFFHKCCLTYFIVPVCQRSSPPRFFQHLIITSLATRGLNCNLVLPRAERLSRTSSGHLDVFGSVFAFISTNSSWNWATFPHAHHMLMRPQCSLAFWWLGRANVGWAYRCEIPFLQYSAIASYGQLTCTISTLQIETLQINYMQGGQHKKLILCCVFLMWKELLSTPRCLLGSGILSWDFTGT